MCMQWACDFNKCAINESERTYLKSSEGTDTNESQTDKLESYTASIYPVQSASMKLPSTYNKIQQFENFLFPYSDQTQKICHVIFLSFTFHHFFFPFSTQIHYIQQQCQTFGELLSLGASLCSELTLPQNFYNQPCKKASLTSPSQFLCFCSPLCYFCRVLPENCELCEIRIVFWFRPESKTTVKHKHTLLVIWGNLYN